MIRATENPPQGEKGGDGEKVKRRERKTRGEDLEMHNMLLTLGREQRKRDRGREGKTGRRKLNMCRAWTSPK